MFHRKRKQVGQRSKYAKIPAKTKLKLLKKVLLDGFSIRDASTLFNINYSTAKTLIRHSKASQYLLEMRATSDESGHMTDGTLPRKRCAYKEIRSEGEEKAEASSNGTSFYLLGSQSEGSGLAQAHLEVTECMKRVEIISSCSYHQ